LVRYGANRFASTVFEKVLRSRFNYKDKQIRFTLPLPNGADKSFLYTPTEIANAQRSRRIPNGSRLVGNDAEHWPLL
jgi:hypothetical protein